MPGTVLRAWYTQVIKIDTVLLHGISILVQGTAPSMKGIVRPSQCHVSGRWE